MIVKGSYIATPGGLGVVLSIDEAEATLTFTPMNKEYTKEIAIEKCKYLSMKAPALRDIAKDLDTIFNERTEMMEGLKWRYINAKSPKVTKLKKKKKAKAKVAKGDKDA